MPTLRAELMLKAFQKAAPLDALLDYPKAFDSFHAFCKGEYAAENTDFWSASGLYMKMAAKAAEPQLDLEEGEEKEAAKAKAEKDAEALAAQRDTIIETYIKEGSDFQINLPSTLAKSLVEKAKTECGLTLFDEAREEIFKLMKRDTLPRYKTSEGFETLVSGLGEPMPIPDCEVPTSLESVRTKFSAS